MVRRKLDCAYLAVLASFAAGCSVPIYLEPSYQRGTYDRKVSPVRVGVYYPEDLRPGWPANSAARMFDGKHGKGAGIQHTVGQKDMNVFVAESLRAELAATGLKVSSSPEFNRPDVDASADSARAAGVDRVVVGRINYFGFVGPVPESSAGAVAGGVVVGGILGGIVAAAVSSHVQGELRQKEVPHSNAYVDIDLWVVETGTGKIVWAGTARGKRNIASCSGARADRIDFLLSESLRDAFKSALWRPDFVAAMGATLSPARTSLAAQAPVHEQAAKAHFQAERFAEAAAEFQMAYQAGGDPALLYNLALSHRKAGNAKQALAAYEDYLRKVPDSPQRPAVEARIKDLKQQLAAPNSPGK